MSRSTLPIHEIFRKDGVVFIYVLKDPRTGAIRYVGKTVDLKWRMRTHLDLKELRQYPCPRASWILSLFKVGVAPLLEVIEECGPESVDDRERYWIAHHRKTSKLTNMTDGGEGGATMTGRKNPWSEEKRKKISAARKGKKSTMSLEDRRAFGQRIAEIRRRNGTTNKGRKWKLSSEVKLRFKLSAQRRLGTPEGKAQLLKAARISAERTRGVKNSIHSQRMKEYCARPEVRVRMVANAALGGLAKKANAMITK